MKELEEATSIKTYDDLALEENHNKDDTICRICLSNDYCEDNPLILPC